MADQSRVANALRKLCAENGNGNIDRKLLCKSMAQLNGSFTESELEAACRHISPDTLDIKVEDFVNWVFDLQSRPHSRWRFTRLGEHIELNEIAEGVKLEFFTDVEGNWEYFLHFVDCSEILSWEGEDGGLFGPGQLTLKENCYLVFGGDAVDKGTGDIRFVKTMLSMKERYWDRVVIIIGNRDINKLRFLNELAEGTDASIYEQRGGPYWLGDKFQSYERFIKEKGMEKGLVSTLHWMFEINMGCQKTTFPGRKRELAMLQCVCRDMDVVRSFRDSVDPNGPDPWMLELLQVGQIAAVLGDCLFIHAGISDKSLGYVPGRDDISDVREWVGAINKWKDEQLEDFLLRPDWREDNGAWRRGGDCLGDYGAPGGSGVFDSSTGKWRRDGRTVVYYGPFDNGNCHLYSEGLQKRLKDASINRVFSGHQPHGQSPTVVRHPKTDLLVMTCDTSYSNMDALKIHNQANNRGDVVTTVGIDHEKVYFKGVLKDGRSHGADVYTDPRHEEGKLPYTLVGRQLKDDSWVKTISDGMAVCVRGFGFQLFESVMHPHKACFQMKQEFFMPSFHYHLRDLQHASQPEVCSTEAREPVLAGYSGHVGNGYNNNLKSVTQFNRAEFESAEVYIFDTRGTIWALDDKESEFLNRKQVEAKVIENINEILARPDKRVVFTTNDSNASREDYLKKMREFGVNICDGEDDYSRKNALQNIITTSYTCAWYIKQCGFKKPFVVCSDDGILEELEALNIKYKATIDRETNQVREEYNEEVTLERVTEILGNGLLDVDAVVIGWDLKITHMKIAVAAAILQLKQDDEKKKVELISCSGDTCGLLGYTPEFWQKDEQFKGFNNKQLRMLGNGAMAEAVAKAASIKESDIVNVGRPGVFFLKLLLDKEEGLGIDPNKAVVVGDTLEVDIAMANLTGMKSLLVLSGVSREEDLGEVEDPKLFPTWVISSLAAVRNS